MLGSSYACPVDLNIDFFSIHIPYVCVIWFFMGWLLFLADFVMNTWQPWPQEATFAYLLMINNLENEWVEQIAGKSRCWDIPRLRRPQNPAFVCLLVCLLPKIGFIRIHFSARRWNGVSNPAMYKKKNKKKHATILRRWSFNVSRHIMNYSS